MTEFVSLHGPPGVGKSSVAQRLGEELGYAVLDYDVFRWRFNAFADPGEHEYAVAFENLLDVLENYMERDQGIVLEGILQSRTSQDPFDSEAIVELANRYGFDRHAFFLSADKETCLERIENAGRDVEDFDELWRLVNDVDRDETEIDTIGRSGAETVEHLIERTAQKFLH